MSSRAPAVNPGKAEAFLHEVDVTNLAAVLHFMQACADDAGAQRLAVHAIGRLAHDEAQLQPLCLAAAAAIVSAAAAFPEDRHLQRLVVASLSSIAYRRQVAALVVGCALPAILAAMLSHTQDQRLQGLALEGLARLAQAGRTAVVKGIVQAVLYSQGDAREEAARQVFGQSLLRLRESEICSQEEVLDVLLLLTESSPMDLHLQRRACLFLHVLVAGKAVDERYAMRTACPLLSTRWAQLLGRFASAGSNELEETLRFHSRVQQLFHEEVGKHFEYEAAERSLKLLRQRADPTERIQEVLRCFVENLEDYQHRVYARKVAWDYTRKQLVPLEADLFLRLRNEVQETLEPSLQAALVAASIPDEGHAEAILSQQAVAARSACANLLALKTELTQTHQERLESLRREELLFEAVEYLELNSKVVSFTQLQTGLHMIDMIEGPEAPDGLERLRNRVTALCTNRTSRPAPAG